METDYVQIDSVEDLDPERITLRDLNKRYIDRNGNRYATRFNLKTRKVEVIRIVKGVHEAMRIKEQARYERQAPAKSIQEKSEEVYEEEDFREPQGNAAPVDFDQGGSPSQPIFYEHSFIEECQSDLDKMKQRLHGVVNNLKGSRVLEMDGGDTIDNQVRAIESVCLTQADELGNYVKELTTYPRPLSHYATRLSADQKDKLDRAPEEQKMDLIKRFELRKIFEEYYTRILDLFGKLLDTLQAVDQEKLRHFPAVQQQSYRDAVSSIGFVLDDCRKKLSGIATWKKRYP
ncbi:MAG: hypothetical protein HS115_02660 [Spirochaetales bacterium]|nr:hypothetical protein [Spirochaetales bacterium]